MTFLFLNASLKREVGSGISFYQHLLPALQFFGVNPILCSNRASSPALQSMCANPLFRFGADEIVSSALDAAPPIRRFEEIWQGTLQELNHLNSLADQSCLYCASAGLAQLMALLVWIGSLKTAKPKLIVDLLLDAPADVLPHLLQQITTRLTPDLSESVKIVCHNASSLSPLTKALGYPVEYWPSPQAAVVPSTREGKAPVTVAILGHQSAPKGFALVPDLVVSLLEKHASLAVLIHNNAPAEMIQQQMQLREIARNNHRLILSETPVSTDVWVEFLKVADILLVPADRTCRETALVNEAIANGIPAIVPAHTPMAERLAEFGLPGLCFESASHVALLSGIDEVIANYSHYAVLGAAARKQWQVTQGAKRIALKVLRWFPLTLPEKESPAAEPPASHPRQLAPAAPKSAGPRVLVSWYCDPLYISPFRLSDHQVTVGIHPLATGNSQMPDQANCLDGYTSFGQPYDLKDILKLQGITGSFDLVVICIDATRVNVPLNAESFGCPTLLHIGDTHHRSGSIVGAVQYSVGQKFDYVISTYNRQHLHWFVEAGHKKVGWIPALAVQHLPRPIPAKRKPHVAFVGQVSPVHARRTRLLHALQAARISVNPQTLTRESAAQLYNSSTLAFNSSLNGDLNLRMFEVMSAGGCLLSDRLAPESGQSTLFEEGREFLAYSSQEELVELARRYIADQKATLAIATAGHAAYTSRYLPQHQAETLRSWIFDDRLPPQYASDWDHRPAIAAAHGGSLATRIGVYEQLQEAHRQHEVVRVLVSSLTPLSVVADMLDLPRVSCHLLPRSPAELETLSKFSLDTRVSHVENIDRARQMPRWDFVIGRVDESANLQSLYPLQYLQIEET